MTLTPHALLAFGLLLLLVVPAADAAPGDSPTPATFRRLAADVDANFERHVLGEWFPRARDTAHGGFHEVFNTDWSPGPDPTRDVVYQSRLTWVASQAHRPDDARHGLAFLTEKQWDQQHGGLFWAVDPDGAPNTPRGGEKHAYGIGFAIYASSAAYRATHDPQALTLARRAFHWLDAHAHDARHGGYYEALTREGAPILTATTPGQNDAIGTPYGEKSMNTHIHILEALTALYEVWPDPTVKTRLHEVFLLVRDKVATPSGYLNLYFRPDWTPAPAGDSFGHDVETAYLLTEASATLGQPDDARTWTVARHLVDHALAHGWDTAHGGFYDHSAYAQTPASTDKIWWTQAEGLNALLLMHERYGHETRRYWDAFLRQWQFIQTRQVDHRYGGWYPTVSRDGTPPPGHVKSDAWTDPYHQGRALMNVAARLRHLAGAHPAHKG